MIKKGLYKDKEFIQSLFIEIHPQGTYSSGCENHDRKSGEITR